LRCPENEEARRRDAGRELSTELQEAARREGATSLALVQSSMRSNRTPGITRREAFKAAFNLADGIRALSGRVHAVVMLERILSAAPNAISFLAPCNSRR